ncbi:type II toxin-antitoxin system RelE/ParE family toxin [Halpernia frigidisoli]|uniref:Phage derived protein Gp49-like n=1 Tax=Halpernia frigidisoli TaxID=1125876 RepID=A0A1I3FU26_9FLAO|nr:type II toxin-antitoxin system RelE/ParE family toxin [Halpernia frigidisoli]SFI14736.1 Phage derived protein Gp49-like [Halpernia frigidisoli]
MRKVDFTDEVLEFINGADPNVKIKIDYILDVLINQSVINTKIAKKLVNTYLYEIRIQVNNEYRILCFCIDTENITQAKEILFINAFLKKSTKDYDKQIKKAIKILEQWNDQN